MGFIAIVGAGPIGGAVAQRLAARDRVREVRLIDDLGEGSVARGKALDLMQSAPLERFSTIVTSAAQIEAGVGAEALVVADSAGNGAEHAGEGGLALVRRLVHAGLSAPIVFAGAMQRDLMSKCVAELHLPRARVIGSAPLALESALRAMVGLALDGSGVEVSLRLVGVPPRSIVVAWEESTASGQPVRSVLPAHVIAGLTARAPGLWPPGPYSLASAAARVAEAVGVGSRRRFTCFVAMDDGPTRTAVTAMPVEIGSGGIERIDTPALTRQEMTQLQNALESR